MKKTCLAALAAIFSLGCGQPSGVLNIPASIQARNPKLLEVTKDYGTLYVIPGEFDQGSEKKPWSSHWYPKGDTYFFKERGGEKAPLQKYDAYVYRNSRFNPGAAAQEESDYTPLVDSWEGLCHAWSRAAILEDEPKHGVGDFDVADIKALLVKSYENLEGLKMYGQAMTGAAAGEDYLDIYPEQFHRFLQVELFQKKRAFIMDFDAGIEKWNVPVYRAITQVTADSSDSHVFHVKTMLRVMKPLQDYDDDSSDPRLAPWRTYTYDLYGYPQAGGSLKVAYGVWTDHSEFDHPDYVIRVEPDQKHWSGNKKVDSAVVQEIAKASR